MGKTFENLTWDDMCDLMCGKPEEDYEEEIHEGKPTDGRRKRRGLDNDEWASHSNLRR